MKSLFARGFRGLSDSVFSGPAGSVFKSVGIDSRSKPGVLKAHQRLIKDSGTTITELCETSVDLSDGSRLWFSSESGKVWREVSGTYSLLTNFDITEWDIRTVAFTDQTLDITTNTVKKTCFLGIRNAGFGNTKFHTGRPGSQFIYGYVNSDGGYQLSDFTFDDSFDHSAQTSDSVAYHMNAAGTKWYVSSSTVIYQYSTGANIDISGSTYDSKSYTPAETTAIWHIEMSADGTKLYVGDDKFGTPTIYQYTLSTAFDVSTASYDSVSYAFDAQIDYFRGGQSLSFSPDGTVLIAYAFPAGSNRARFFQFDLSTPFDLATASYAKSWQFRSSEFYQNIESIHLQEIPAVGIYEAGNRMFMTTTSIQNLTLSGSFSTSSSGPHVVREAALSDAAASEAILGAEEHTGLGYDTFEAVFSPTTAEVEQFVYFATSKYVFRFRTSDIGSIEENIVPVGTFFNGNATHHPFVKQNSNLFIGDGNVVAEVDSRGLFTAVTNFNLPLDETVTAISRLDLDVLVGTQVGNRGRVLRWDGISETTSAEDVIYEKGGVRAFIEDDNFVYPVIGQRGSIYYYNGSKCEDFLTIPEVEDGQKIDVRKNAVGFYQGTPLFGLSNDTGNPVLQGVYGYGSYNTNYAKSLSLDYPMPSGEFSGVTIGSILVDGDDLYVSWKDGTDVGIAKIDLTTKYASAYFETINLTPPMNRHQAKTISDVMVPYYTLPASTGVTIGVDKDYSGSFTNMEVLTDSIRKFVKLKSPSVTDTVNPRLRIGLTTNGNNSPEIEDVLFNIAPTGPK